MPMSFKRFFEEGFGDDDGDVTAEEAVISPDVAARFSQQELNQRRKAVSGRYIRSGRAMSPFTGLQAQEAAAPTVEPVQQAPTIIPQPGNPAPDAEGAYSGGDVGTSGGGMGPGARPGGEVGRVPVFGSNINFGGIQAPGMEGELDAMEAGYGTDIGDEFAASMGRSGAIGGLTTGLGALALGAPVGALPGLTAGGIAASMFSPVGVGIGVADALAKSKDVSDFRSGMENVSNFGLMGSDDMAMAAQSGTGALSPDAFQATSGSQFANAALEAFEPRGMIGQLTDAFTGGKGLDTNIASVIPGIGSTVGGTGPAAALDAGMDALFDNPGGLISSEDNLAGAVGLDLNRTGGVIGTTTSAPIEETPGVFSGRSAEDAMAQDAQSKATAATMGRVAASGLDPNMVTPENRGAIEAAITKGGTINVGHLEQQGVDTGISGVSTVGGGMTGAGPNDQDEVDVGGGFESKGGATFGNISSAPTGRGDQDNSSDGGEGEGGGK